MATQPALASPNLKSNFLRSIPEREAELILAAARFKSWRPKQLIVRAGEAASHLYLLTRGQVRYFRPTLDGQEVLIGWLDPGDVFGLGTLLQRPGTYIGSAETAGFCEALTWPHRTIRSLAQRHPGLATNALRIVLNYLRSYVERHASLRTMSAEERLTKVLLHLSRRSARVSPQGVEIGATNEQLSALADMTPFTASRILSRWRRRGAIAKKRGGIVVRRPEALVKD